jgi:hypothetical protein
VRAGEAVVLTGQSATHRMACHNPPTREEAVAGRPLRQGFRAAPPPGGPSEAMAGVPDELAEPDAWYVEAGDVEFLPGEGPTTATGGAAGLPLPPEEDL